MRFFTGKILSFENQVRDATATPDLKSIVKNIFSSFLSVMISLSLLIMLLVPNVLGSLGGTIFLHDIFEWVLVLANILLLGFLLTVSVILLVQSLVDYRNTRNLQRFGVVTKGLLVDKWVDISDEKPAYYVRYKYLAQMQAVQTVGQDMFQRLKRDENVPILHLEQFPYISRVDLS